MADDKLYGLKEKTYNKLVKLLSLFDDGLLELPGVKPQKPDGNNRRLACLVDSVGSFSTGRAVAIAPKVLSHSYTIWHAGSLPDPVSASAWFTISINNVESGQIPVFATAQEFKTVLESFSELSSDGALAVSLGTFDDPDLLPSVRAPLYPRRWFIEIDYTAFPQAPTISVVSSSGLLWRPFASPCSFRATKQVLKVTCPFSVADPTQLVPGTIVGLEWFSGFGWCITSAEPRKFDGCSQDLSLNFI